MKPMLALGVVVCMSVAILGQERDRAKVADKFKWNLADLYPTDAAWRTAKNRTTAEIPKLQEFQGALGFMSRLDKELSRQYVYASMQSDLDTRQSGPQGMQQEMQQTYATFGAAASYIEPEILKIGSAKVDQFIAAERRVGLLHLLLHPLRPR